MKYVKHFISITLPYNLSFHFIVFHLLTYSTISANCDGSGEISESIYCSSTFILSTDFDDPTESIILIQPSSTVPVESEPMVTPTSSSSLLAFMDTTSALVTDITPGSQTLEFGLSQSSSLSYGTAMTSSFLLQETTFSPSLPAQSSTLMSSVLSSSLLQSLSHSILSTQPISTSSFESSATPTPSLSPFSSSPLVVTSSEKALETLSSSTHDMFSSSLFATATTAPTTNNSLVSSFSSLFTQISTTPTSSQSVLLHSLFLYRLFVTFYSNKVSSSIFYSHSYSISTE